VKFLQSTKKFSCALFLTILFKENYAYQKITDLPGPVA